MASSRAVLVTIGQVSWHNVIQKSRLGAYLSCCMMNQRIWATSLGSSTQSDPSQPSLRRKLRPLATH